MTHASSQLAKAQEVAALKGLRAAMPFFIEATDALAREKQYDAAVGVLAEVLNAREKKRSLFGSKVINPLGPDRAVVSKQFAKLTRHARVDDSILELLGAIAAENPDDPDIRLANAEGLYHAAYIADAIDEYRYCEKLAPEDGATAARLGELYAIMSRNAEAVDHLRRGIGELMQAQRFDEVPAFALKLFETAPESASDVQGWLESLPDSALSRRRGEARRVIDAVREAGLDDGRWSTLEQRLGSLPPPEGEPEPQPIAKSALEEGPVAEPAAALLTEAARPEEEPVWGSQRGLGTRSAWYDVSSVEPASEDEMRALLGPSQTAASTEHESATALANGVAPAASVDTQPASAAPPAPAKAQPSAPPNIVSAPSVSIGNTQPTSVGGLPPGLTAFTRRKADASFQAGDFAGAATGYERLIKTGFAADIAAPLVDCYLGLQRFSEASKLGLQLADHQASAGEVDKAVATLAVILEQTSDPEVERRHSELLAAKI